MTKTDYAAREHHEFLDASAAALRNANLQLALANLGQTLGQRNKDAFAAFPDSAALRERARAIKDDTLAELDRHLGTLATSVERVGGHVRVVGRIHYTPATVRQAQRWPHARDSLEKSRTAFSVVLGTFPGKAARSPHT